MKNLAKFLAIPVLFVLIAAFAPVGEELAIGAEIPKSQLKMKDAASDKTVSLADVKTIKGLLVVFSCNTCPYVKLSESRIKDLQEICKNQRLGMIIVNSNEAQRDGDDSEAEMKSYASAQGFTVPYVLDVKSELADAFGASRTPQCFLFDGEGKLAYKGAIDDNVKDPKAVTKAYLRDAITAVTKNQKPAVTESKSIGCTIKRAE